MGPSSQAHEGFSPGGPAEGGSPLPPARSGRSQGRGRSPPPLLSLRLEVGAQGHDLLWATREAVIHWPWARKGRHRGLCPRTWRCPSLLMSPSDSVSPQRRPVTNRSPGQGTVSPQAPSAGSQSALRVQPASPGPSTCRGPGAGQELQGEAGVQAEGQGPGLGLVGVSSPISVPAQGRSCSQRSLGTCSAGRAAAGMLGEADLSALR